LLSLVCVWAWLSSVCERGYPLCVGVVILCVYLGLSLLLYSPYCFTLWLQLQYQYKVLGTQI